MCDEQLGVSEVHCGQPPSSHPLGSLRLIPLSAHCLSPSAGASVDRDVRQASAAGESTKDLASAPKEAGALDIEHLLPCPLMYQLPFPPAAPCSIRDSMPPHPPAYRISLPSTCRCRW